MREEEPSWFARWEEDLPSPEELMPLTQTLITPDLALAFDIPSPDSAAAAGAGFLRHGIHTQLHHHHHHVQHKEPAFPPSSQPSPTQSQGPSSQLQQHALAQSAAAAADYDSSELGGAGSGGGGGAGSGGGDEQARTLKRPRLVWTPQLHKRFVDAVAHLGIKNAVPKTIMQLMSVEGLTRENVASHLQKYRLYLKRMQGLSGGPGGGVGQIPHADQATEQLFASGPVPHPLLHHRGPTPGGPVGGGGVGTPDQFFPFASMAPLHPHQPQSQSQHQQMVAAAAAAAAAANYQQQQHQQTHQHHQQYYQQHRQAQQQMLGSSPGNGYEHGFLSGRQQHHPAAALQRMMGPVGIGMGASTGFGSSSPFGEDLDSGGGGGPERRKELTLFPTNDG